jgi:hypothetical protein
MREISDESAEGRWIEEVHPIDCLCLYPYQYDGIIVTSMQATTATVKPIATNNKTKRPEHYQIFQYREVLFSG